MSCPLPIFRQSDYLIQIVAINSHTYWQTVPIQISWLLQKPTDLDLHCLQMQGISGFSRSRVKMQNVIKALTVLVCRWSLNVNWKNGPERILTLKTPITTIVVCFVICLWFQNHFCKQCGPRLDCSLRSSLIWVHIVCLYVKIGLKSLQEYSADDINRRHFQMQVFMAF